MSLINVNNLTFKYPNTENYIFKNIDFDIEKSKINLIIGSSGCGKSTVIKCITGLIPNSIEGELSGQVYYKGENIVGKMPYELCTEIGIVFQDPDSQFCTFTVEDEIAFGLENLKLSRKEIDGRISKVLDLVGITFLRERVLNTLSGGEKQKVAVASVLALDPNCIILDEPTANLDPKSTIEIFELLKYLREKKNKTIILIEHKIDDVIEFADNIIFFGSMLKNVVSGTAEEVIYSVCSEYEKLPLWVPETVFISKKLKNKGLSSREFYKKKEAVFSILKISNLFRNYNHNTNKDNENNSTKLKIENLSYSYNRKNKILNDINIEIKEGDFTAILGYNGAGKSTLSKIILGLYKDYNGSIFIDNKNLKSYKRKELNSKIGLVFQNPEHQFVANTVYDELSYSLKVNGMNEKNIEKTVNEYLKKFNLKEQCEQNPYLLSQGQKRRLSAASMLISGQDILILDEPTFGQDRKNTKELMDYMKSINLSGVTIIIITHDINVVSSYCNKAVVLSSGKIAYNGNVDELFKNDDILEKAKLEVPVMYNISSDIKKVDNKFPLFLNNEEFMRALDGVEVNDKI